MRFAVLVSLTLALAAGEVMAQERPAATALLKRADAIQQRKLFPEKARLYEQAAGLLPPGAPETEAVLRMAASLYYFTGSPARAQTLLERVAEEAFKRGENTRAAEAYVDATFIALERNDQAAARQYADRATLLAWSATVPEADRTTLLRRLARPVRFSLKNSQ